MLGIIILALHNLRSNQEFFKTSLLSIFQLLVVVVISFIFVQRKTDTRKQADVVDGLVRKSSMAFDELHRLILVYADHILAGGDLTCCAEEREEIQGKVRLLENYFSSLKRPKVSEGFLKTFASVEKSFSEYTSQFESVFPGNNDNRAKIKEMKRIYEILVAKLADLAVEIYFPSKQATKAQE